LEGVPTGIKGSVHTSKAELLGSVPTGNPDGGEKVHRPTNYKYLPALKN
jgi:hypothetical protein